MSTAKFDTLSNLAGSQTVPVSTVAQGSAKAWVNFNGTGTVAIRASFNVSSITDNGTGNYTVNFTTALPDANYAAVFGGGDTAITSGVPLTYITTTTTTSQTFRTYNYSGGGQFDVPTLCVSIFR
jgi:hypothetical protein